MQSTQHLPGVTYYPEFITEEEEEIIIDSFPHERFNHVMFRGVYMLRTKTWQSDKNNQGKRPKYIFPGWKQMPEQDDWDPCIEDIRDYIENHFGTRCTQAILTLYKDGNASIGSHKDKHEDEFFIVSVGAPRKLCFSTTPSGKATDIIKKITLESRSMLHVTKEANNSLYHSLRKESSIRDSRISIVFRPIPIE